MSLTYIIVPAYNNLDITFRCVAALQLFKTAETRIVLVDNGSTDPIHTLKESVEASGGVYIRLDPNRGPYGAVNAGIAKAQEDGADFIGVCCNDVVVLPGTIPTIMSVVSERLPYVGAVGMVEPAFEFYHLMAKAAIEGRFTTPGLFRGPHFSFFIAHKSLFEKVGTFDERFGLTFGDTDHEQRCVDAGVPMVQVSSAVIFHGHGTGRKRSGMDADIRQDLGDYARFVEKYKDRPDVLARHPAETEEQKRAALEVFWKAGER